MATEQAACQSNIAAPPALVMVAVPGPNGSNAIVVAEVLECYSGKNGRGMAKVRVCSWVNRQFEKARRIDRAAFCGAPPAEDARVKAIHEFRARSVSVDVEVA